MSGHRIATAAPQVIILRPKSVNQIQTKIVNATFSLEILAAFFPGVK